MSQSTQRSPGSEQASYELEHQGPIPRTVLRRERRVAAGLLAAITVLAVGGFMTIPTEDEVVHTASTHPNPLTRVRAVNTMIRRGYWEDKTYQDFERFIKAGPPEISQFMADMHGNLLKPDRRAWKK